MARPRLEDRGRQGSSWWTRQQTVQPRALVRGNKASNHWLKTPGGWGSSGRNSQLHRGVHWRDPKGPRTYTNPPTQELAPEGPNLIVGSGGSDWNLAESWARTIIPSWTPSPHTASQWVAPPWWTPKAPSLYVTGMPTHTQKWPKWKNRSNLQKKYN